MNRAEILRSYRDNMGVPIKGYYVEFTTPSRLSILMHGSEANPSITGLMFGQRAWEVMVLRDAEGYSRAPMPIRTIELANQFAEEAMNAKYHGSGTPVSQFEDGTTWRVYDIAANDYAPERPGPGLKP